MPFLVLNFPSLFAACCRKDGPLQICPPIHDVRVPQERGGEDAGSCGKIFVDRQVSRHANVQPLGRAAVASDPCVAGVLAAEHAAAGRADQPLGHRDHRLSVVLAFMYCDSFISV